MRAKCIDLNEQQKKSVTYSQHTLSTDSKNKATGMRCGVCKVWAWGCAGVGVRMRKYSQGFHQRINYLNCELFHNRKYF